MKSIEAMIVPPSSGRRIAAVTKKFWQQEIAQGDLLTVFYLPGLVWVHTGILEAWFEAIPKKLLAANRVPGWREEQNLRRAEFIFKPDWLRRYANALTLHAVAIGALVRGRCMFCGTEPVQAHHPDYTDPLRVTWLCAAHHTIVHQRIELFPQYWWRRTKRPAIERYSKLEVGQ